MRRPERGAQGRLTGSVLREVASPAMLALAVLAALVFGSAKAAPRSCDAASRGPASPSFSNPVVDANYPDPFVLRTAGSFIAYATNSHGHNVPTLRSRDLVDWQPGGDALHELPGWARAGFTWAPEVMAVGGRYLLYSTARARQGAELQCIGVAVAERAEGPFRSSPAEPLVCEPEKGGSIDPSPFRASDGQLYLYWKSDGNAVGRPTWLLGQPLSADGLSLTGNPTRLLRNDTEREGRLIEAPSMLHLSGRYLLLFSANDFGSRHYAVGYANAFLPLGPFRKAPENPILSTAPGAFGPGHQALIQDDAGQIWTLYHAWREEPSGRQSAERTLWLDRVEVRSDGSLAAVLLVMGAQLAPWFCPVG